MNPLKSKCTSYLGLKHNKAFKIGTSIIESKGPSDRQTRRHRWQRKLS